MRIAFVGDVHLGNHKRHGGPLHGGLNDRARLGLQVFRAAVDRALTLNCAAFVCVGDLLDYSRPEAPLLAEVGAVIADNVESLDFVLLVGNHEQESADPNDHALAPLVYAGARVVEGSELVTVKHRDSEGRPRAGGVDLLCFAYHKAPPDEWLASDLKAMLPATGGRDAIAAVHLGIADEKTAPWLVGARDSIHVDALAALVDAAGLRAAVAGNWHDYTFWPSDGTNASIVQVGALVPTGWDNPGLDAYGRLVVVDTAAPRGADITVEHIPGPRFVKVRSLEEAEQAKAVAYREGHKLFLQLVVPHEEVSDALDAVGAMREGKTITQGEVVIDASRTAHEARLAASAARAATTLEEALVAYIAEMPLSGEVDRTRVESRARGYLCT